MMDNHLNKEEGDRLDRTFQSPRRESPSTERVIWCEHTCLENREGRVGFHMTKVSPNWSQTECNTVAWKKRRGVGFNTPFLPSPSPMTPTLDLVLWEVAERDASGHSKNQWDSALYRAAPAFLTNSVSHLMTIQPSNIAPSWYWLVFLPESLLDLLQIDVIC